MIIECPNCNKKFNVNPELITDNGREIQCGSCNHLWFYQKEKKKLETETPTFEDNIFDERDDPNINNDTNDENIESPTLEDNIVIEKDEPNIIDDTNDENIESPALEDNIAVDRDEPNIVDDSNDLSVKENQTKINQQDKKIVHHSKTKNKKTKKNIGSKFFSYLIVLIISFIALIILLDTFKTPLYSVFPYLETILFSLFETLQDIKLFIIDLS